MGTLSDFVCLWYGGGWGGGGYAGGVRKECSSFLFCGLDCCDDGRWGLGVVWLVFVDDGGSADGAGGDVSIGTFGVGGL